MNMIAIIAALLLQLPAQSASAEDNFGRPFSAAAAEKSGPASQFAEYQRHAKLVSGSLDHGVTAENIRWAKRRDGAHFWDAASIAPGQVKNIYWGNHTNGVGHSFLVLEFAPGGFASTRPGAEISDFLAVSVEARMGEGESYSALLGAFGKFMIVWNLSAFESYIYDGVVEGDESPFAIYRMKLTGEQKIAVARAALSGAFRDHENEKYNTAYNSCVTNALATLNSALPYEYQVEPLIAVPAKVTEMLDERGLLETGGDARFSFSRQDPTAGGRFTAR